VQAGLTRNYVAAYREHRIEPYGQSIFNYPPLVIKDEGVESDLDWDLFAQFGASYRQLVFEGAIAPPILFLPDPKNPPPRNVLQAIGKAIKRGEVPKGSMAYVWDEGEESPLMTERALSRAKWVKELAPGIRVMLTRAPSPGFLKYVDVFFVLQNLFSVPEGKPFGLYVSCVSQGSCVNGVRGYPSGTPMMVLDAPTIHPRAFLWLNHRLGASFSLYYNATQMLTTAWTHQYAFGGNGDGTLLYPDLHEGIPDVSIRMKMLRQGSFDVEYLTWAEKAGIHYQSPVKNQFQWSPRFSDYQRLRDELGTKLDARWHLSEVFH
jgi:hypothetical protein